MTRITARIDDPHGEAGLMAESPTRVKRCKTPHCNCPVINIAVLFTGPCALQFGAFCMTIKAKILCLVAAFAIFATIITGLGLRTMADYNHAIDDYRHASDNAFNGERLNRYMTEAALEMRGIYMAQDDAEALLAADRADARADRLNAFVQDWTKQLRPGELPEFDALHDKVLGLAKGGHFIAQYTRQHGRAAAFTIGATPDHLRFREQMQMQIDAMVAHINQREIDSRAALRRFETQRQQQFLVMAFGGILLLVAGSLWIAITAIARPLNRLRDAIIRVSEGGYDTPIPADAGGREINALWAALDILKSRAVEAERLTQARLDEEHRLRELVLD